MTEGRVHAPLVMLSIALIFMVGCATRAVLDHKSPPLIPGEFTTGDGHREGIRLVLDDGGRAELSYFAFAFVSIEGTWRKFGDSAIIVEFPHVGELARRGISVLRIDSSDRGDPILIENYIVPRRFPHAYTKRRVIWRQMPSRDGGYTPSSGAAP